VPLPWPLLVRECCDPVSEKSPPPVLLLLLRPLLI
jgi:hypothetical protein